MTTDRDPRTEPRAGDFVMIDGYRVAVVDVERGYLTADGPRGRSYMPLNAWRAWASSATVVKKGGEG